MAHELFFAKSSATISLRPPASICPCFKVVKEFEFVFRDQFSLGVQLMLQIVARQWLWLIQLIVLITFAKFLRLFKAVQRRFVQEYFSSREDNMSLDVVYGVCTLWSLNTSRPSGDGFCDLFVLDEERLKATSELSELEAEIDFLKENKLSAKRQIRICRLLLW
jgi:hypothetical protein